MTADDRDLHALEGWLAPRLPGEGDVRLTNEGQPGSGFSAETTILAATRGDTIAKVVLRKETPDPPVYPTQAPGYDCEVDIQWRVMSAIAGGGIDAPLAPLIGYEADPAVLGAPFFVMGFVDGVVPIENPMYTQEGFFTELEPAQRRAMLDEGLRALAAIHTIDWRAGGLAWLTGGADPTTARQLDVWQAYMERELAGRVHPQWDRALAWLRDRMPEETPPVLCWGDSRPGNVIWRDDRCACLTDFEAASIAPPENDLGWWLMFDRFSHEAYGAERLPGEPTRDEQRAMYEAHAGRDVGDTTWFEVAAAARYTAIVVRVMNRTVARGLMPEDQTIWLENPATTTLQLLIDEHGI